MVENLNSRFTAFCFYGATKHTDTVVGDVTAKFVGRINLPLWTDIK